MSHQEVKQEGKELEGNPEIKGRIRQLQREAARKRMMAAVPAADVIVTNPTHYAVALAYKSGMGAPKVLAKGHWRDRAEDPRDRGNRRSDGRSGAAGARAPSPCRPRSGNPGDALCSGRRGAGLRLSVEPLAAERRRSAAAARPDSRFLTELVRGGLRVASATATPCRRFRCALWSAAAGWPAADPAHPGDDGVAAATLLLDLFFTFNIAISVIVMLVAMSVMKPLDFSVFPTVLLVTTLLRLSLNVASTRVVLLEGHTGPARPDR
jgi:hypothetical protein